MLSVNFALYYMYIIQCYLDCFVFNNGCLGAISRQKYSLFIYIMTLFARANPLSNSDWLLLKT